MSEWACVVSATPDRVTATPAGRVRQKRFSRSLLSLARKLAQNESDTARRVAEVVREAVPGYRTNPDPVFQNEVDQHCLLVTRLWYAALLSSRTPSAAELSEVTALGAYKARVGVLLAGVLQAFRVGSMVYWDELVAGAGQDAQIREELLTGVSVFFLRHFDLMAQAISRGYYAEQQQTVRWRDRVRHEIYCALYEREGAGLDFVELALALGVDPAAPHVAVAMKIRGVSDLLPGGGGAIDQLAREIGEAMGLPGKSLLCLVRHGYVLVWMPSPRGELVATGADLARGLTHFLWQSHREIRQVGIGLPDSGLVGFRRSADQAARAITLAADRDPPTPGTTPAIHCYLDVAIQDMMLHADGFPKYCMRLVERLAKEGDLLQTLEAYFASRQRRKAAAASLRIHPNTLSYRLERVETLLGAKLDDPNWISILHAALKLRQLPV